jgi:hypothetical protein
VENKTIIKKITIIQTSKSELERLKSKSYFNVTNGVHERKVKMEFEYDRDMLELMGSIYY